MARDRKPWKLDETPGGATATTITSRRYIIRARGEWVSMVLTQDTAEKNGHGIATFTGSFGNWTHEWFHTGEADFRQFMARTYPDYVQTKLGLGIPDKFDGDATEEAVKKEILSMRRDRGLGRDEAREMWEDIRFYDGESSFHDWINEHDGHAYHDWWQLGVWSPPGDLVALCHEAFPAFQELLRRELVAEGSKSSRTEVPFHV